MLVPNVNSSSFPYSQFIVRREAAMSRLVAAAIGAVVVAAGALLWLARQNSPPAIDAGARRVRVAAAADLQFAFDEVRTAFERVHPDIRVEATHGSSGNFFTQLVSRAPFDLFLSADMDYPRRLAKELGSPETAPFAYAVGHLVIWVPRQSGIAVDRLGIKTLLDPSVRKIAIANPRHAPYGRAAEAALKSLKVYDSVKDRLVLGENVAQAAQFVQSGAADAGVFSRSLALAPALRDAGSFWEVPENAYPRLTQGGLILPWAEDPAAAATLRDFLLGSEGRAVLKRFGFDSPGE
jgi:molybdate transport system substrate-binding protein